MNKKLIALAIAGAIAAPAAMANNVTVYGKIRQSLSVVDTQFAGGATIQDAVEIQNQSSRLGFKGSEDLGNGLKAIWKMEFSVNISGNGSTADGSGGDTAEVAGGGAVGGRNAYVGLSGDFGTVIIGRHDTPMKMSTGKLDLFVDTVTDNNAASMSEDLQNFRANGTIAYITPTFNGFHAAAAIIPGEDNGVGAGAGDDGLADSYSVSLNYQANGVFASAAYESIDQDAFGGTDDYENWRVGLGYSMNNFTVSVIYDEQEAEFVDGAGLLTAADGSADKDEREAWVIAGSYTMGNNVIKAKYFDVDFDGQAAGGFTASTGLTGATVAGLGATTDYDGWAIGLDHNFSKRTQASLIYVDTDADTAGGVEGDVFSLQLNHNF